MADEYTPNLVCFSCKFGWGYVSNDKPIRPGRRTGYRLFAAGKWIAFTFSMHSKKVPTVS